MRTCELSLSHADPDVNRGPLMSKEVDKQAFILTPSVLPPLLSGVLVRKWPLLSQPVSVQLRGQLSSDRICFCFVFFGIFFLTLGVKKSEATFRMYMFSP